MFVHQAPSNLRGSIAEMAIAKAAALAGLGVLMPMTEHGRYEFVFQIDNRFLRVQCKSATRKGEMPDCQADRQPPLCRGLQADPLLEVGSRFDRGL